MAKQGSLITATGMTGDMVSVTAYDGQGKNINQYLPYTASSNDGSYKPSAVADQTSWYNSGNSPLAGQSENHFYGQAYYEGGFSGRVVQSFAPGASWVGSGRGVQSNAFPSTESDSVYWFVATDQDSSGASFCDLIFNEYYDPGGLYKTITTNEAGRQTIVFKNMQGNVVLTKIQSAMSAHDDGSGNGYEGWICTYYIYDAVNRLRCIVQPNGVKALISARNDINNIPTVFNEQCFLYEYDYRGNLTMQKKPGAGETRIVYDAKNRPVLVQDANMRSSNTWIATIYDRLNRPVETGTCVNATGFSSLLSQVAASSSFVPTLATLLTLKHYDDYAELPAGLSATYLHTWDSYLEPSSTTVYPYAEQPVQDSATTTQGMATWSSVAILDSTPAALLAAVNIYDDKGRVIQTQSKNITGGVDVATVQYSWAGRPLVTVQKQEEKKSGVTQTTVVVTKMTYDDLGRLVKTEMRQSNTKVKSGVMSAYATISQMQYDALGNVKTKLLGDRRTNDSTYNTTPLETQTFDYNVRGWLLGMNRAYARDKGSADSSAVQGDGGSGESFTEGQDATVIYPATNYFGFDLGYDKTSNNLINSQSYDSARYDGNITGMVWKSAYDGKVRKYDFAYDPASRLTGADFNQYTGHTFNKTANVDYSMSGLNYDANGNITAMSQKGLKSIGSSAVIDQLTYTYQTGSNRLAKVADAAAVDSAEHLGDFQDGINTGDDYTYDSNGNLTQDLNKNIAAIAYNILNLPSVIRVNGKGSIYYTYDAAGNKLRKITIDSTSLPARVTATLYVSGSVYQNDTLQFFGTGEGRARPVSPPSGGAGGGWVYDYFLKDHLGNIRMVITDDYNVTSPILEANSYSPFGLEQKNIGLQATGNMANRYKFNGGSELNSDFNINLYETNFRSLDPQLGRFWQVDPMAKQSCMLSPYSYAADNFISNNDPTGLIPQQGTPEYSRYVRDFYAYNAGNIDVLKNTVDFYTSYNDMADNQRQEMQYNLDMINGFRNSGGYTAREMEAINNYYASQAKYLMQFNPAITGFDINVSLSNRGGVTIGYSFDIAGSELGDDVGVAADHLSSEHTDDLLRSLGFDVPEEENKWETAKDVIGLGFDAKSIPLTIGKIALKNEGSIIKPFTGPATAVGAVIGMGTATYDLLTNPHPNYLKDGFQIGLGAVALYAEFVGVGEIWDWIGLGAGAVSTGMDINDMINK